MAALALASTACGQSDSDNVMAPSANALSPEQVDAALGPEVSNAVENEPETVDAVETASPYRPLNVTETAPASRPADERPPEDTPDETVTDNTSAEATE